MKKLYFFLLFVLAFTVGNAQYYYVPYINAGINPGDLNKDTEYPPGGGLVAGWTTIFTGPQVSGAWSPVRTIPFPFDFNGSPVTEYKASSSGIVTFSTATTMTVDSNNTALPNANIPDNSVMVWGLRCAANDYIVTKTFGTAPNRQHWIGYYSFSEPNLGVGWIYASIVLEETSNKIYIVDQRTQCVLNGAVCTNKTNLTLGIQVDQNTAVMVQGSPNFQSDNKNSPAQDDNSYYEFIHGSQIKDDVVGLSHDFRKYYTVSQFPLMVNGSFKNSGSDAITNVEYSYNVNDGLVYSQDIANLNVPSLSNFMVTHPDPWTEMTAGTYVVKSWMSKINGADPVTQSDDTIHTVVIVNDTAVIRKLMHENFSSSTCPPCKPGNETLHAVVGQYPGLFSELTYHYYFPGTGDPYYTTEARDRGTYYNGVNAIPATLLDGKININPNGYNTATFEEYQNIPAFHTVVPSGKVTGQKIEIEVEVGALIPTNATTRLQVAVAEKLTFKNIKNNGETEFPHVMKKMIPNVNGTLTGVIGAGETKKFNFTWNVPGSYRLPLDAQAANIINLATEHSIEEFDDLEVFAWLQESDKSILQSNSADLEFVVSNDNPVVLKSVTASPSLASDYFFLDMSAFDASNILRVMITDVNGNIIHSEKTPLKSLFINSSNWTSGMYYVKVVGNNEEGLQKVVIVE